ncbi:MAG: hypothetical protein HDT20_01280 [Oscillibacter sp.]|nr:hypothetical protein [Oscillibacter sp.]
MGRQMEYYIGIDGGGSKTRFLCVDSAGRAAGTSLQSGIYCNQCGLEAVITTLKRGIAECLPDGADRVIIGCGMPAYGEDPELDAKAVREITRALAPMPVRFENDVIVGWAGALAMAPGITIVGGTGTIGYGQDPQGGSTRCGGWHEFFSDEGSGYWLGKRLLQIFSKESDGRLSKTQLYPLLKERLGLQNDFDLATYASTKYSSSRKETAALQPILLEAARAGDPYALRSYDEATDEMVEIILGVIRNLSFPENEPIRISYSGGLFTIDDLVLQPVKDKLLHRGLTNAVVSRPELSPCQGAVLLAIEQFEPAEFEAMKKNMSDLGYM